MDSTRQLSHVICVCVPAVTRVGLCVNKCAGVKYGATYLNVSEVEELVLDSV